jgi:hypothetical protein
MIDVVVSVLGVLFVYICLVVFCCNIFSLFYRVYLFSLLVSLKKYSIMPDINITNHGIAKLLSNLDPSKAAGPDELKPKILKELAPNISPILCLIWIQNIVVVCMGHD